MNQTIWYDKRVPQEIKDALEPVIIAQSYVLPTWCQEIAVHFDPEQESAASMYANKPYRIAHLTVSGGWLRAAEKERIDMVRHEFVHVVLSIMTNWTKDTLNRLITDDKRLLDWLLDEWGERLEGATCDFEVSLRRIDNDSRRQKIRGAGQA